MKKLSAAKAAAINGGACEGPFCIYSIIECGAGAAFWAAAVPVDVLLSNPPQVVITPYSCTL